METVHRRASAFAAGILLAVFSFLLAAAAFAGSERYDYDPLGRLIRNVDSNGQVTEYVYDAAGNLLEVRRAGTADQLVPAIQSVAPASARRGQTIAVRVTGSRFTGARLSAPDARLSVGQLQVSAGTLEFELAVGADTPLGAHSFTLSNAGGSASFAIDVAPVLPRLQVSPLPLAVLPDGIDRQFALTLSNADSLAHTIGLAISDTTRASVSPATLTFAPGVTQARASLRGLNAGNAILTLTSPTLASILVPVFVTVEVSGINTAHAPTVGVQLQALSQPSVRSIDPLLGAQVGVLQPPYIEAVSPNVLQVGSGPTQLVISGAGLANVTGISIVPNTGLTLGAIALDAAGTAVRIPVSVAPDAPPSVRQVVLSGPKAPYRAATPEADRLRIALPTPEIHSIEPLAAVPGTSGLAFVVRGRNLQGAQPISVSPAANIQVGSAPSVNAEGTRLDTTLEIGLAAALGERIVTLNTPGGSSDATPSSANTFRVVNQLIGSVDPISAPPVGVLKQAQPEPSLQEVGLGAPQVGLALGAAVLSLSPAAGVIGSSVELSLSGIGLADVSAVQFTPPDGLTVDAPVPAADGRSVSVRVAIASGAPQTLRKVRVLHGASEIAFSSPQSALFRVTGPQPRVDSINPIYLQIGASAVAMSVQGVNFQSASQVRVVPSDGITLSVPPQINAQGTQASVNVVAATGAAPGPRTLVVVTPAGESALEATAANTLTLVLSVGPSFNPIVAAAVGVVKESSVPPVQTEIGPFIAPNVRVNLESAPVLVSTNLFLTAPGAGVALGASATGVQAPALIPGASGTLSVSGFNLQGVSAIALYPAEGITLGSPQPSAEGTQLSVPFSVSPSAAPGPRELVLSAGSTRIAFSRAAAARLFVAAGAPAIASLTPILGAQGSSVTLRVLGQNLFGASAVLATPAEGLSFEPTALINAAGTQLDLRVYIAPNAALGARVIQVITPGGTSSALATPANTFTVVPP